MKLTYLIGWVICLLIAFMAAVLSVNNSVKLVVMEQRLEEVRKTANDERAVLEEIRDVLQAVEADLAARR
ncbi:MAG: hypothetical protein PVJ27_00090 [Candidatus Brocadiaceae bacterium]|jgi:hypothetical protein